MIAKIKERYLQIVVTILCLCMLGGIQGKEARAASGYPLLQKVQTAENGSFVKTWGGWRYMYQDGTYPKKTWKKIKSNVFYFDICRQAGDNIKNPGIIFVPAERKRECSVKAGRP